MSLNTTAALFVDQTLEIRLFSGSGLEGNDTKLPNFDIDISGTFDGPLTGIPVIAVQVWFSVNAGSYSLLLSAPNATSGKIRRPTIDSRVTPTPSCRYPRLAFVQLA